MERRTKAHDLIDESTHKLVKSKACYFARRRRCANDPADLEQEVMLQLVRRCHRFNPQKGCWTAFAKVVCRTQLLSVLEQHCAQRRSRSKEAGSLNARAQRGAGDELVSQLASDCHARRLGGSGRSEQEQLDTRIDLDAAMTLLPSTQRQICERLKVDSPTDVARDLGMSRGALYDHIGQIRERFDQAYLREHL